MSTSVAMYAWIPIALSLFWLLPLRYAIVVGYLLGWLFLPQSRIPLEGLPDYTRMAAVNLAMLLGALLRDLGGLLRLRPTMWDLPMVVWCLCPVPTALTNDLGLYDGLSGATMMFLTWGAPYLLGRAFFSDWGSARLLAISVFVGGLVCVPLCLWEIRMSPNLHYTVYGFHPTVFERSVRLGGYRPMLFLQHGVAVGLWMCSSALVGVWLWRSGTIRRLRGVSVSWLATGLLITAILCRSLNSLMLLAGGAVVLLATRYLRTRLALLVLILAPAMYVGLRAPQLWHPSALVEISSSLSPDRGASLESRLDQERRLVVKAWRRPLFGWGGWSRSRVERESGELVETDSLWIIAFGQYGLVGLISLGLVFALPALLLWRRFTLADWWSATFAPAGALAIVIVMYAGDCLMNAMLNPVYHLAIGAVLGCAVSAAKQVREPAPASHPRL